ncbi:autotransporter assembly complex protein TamA [Ideonella sp. BN130291]|uniref:autotransporter assembly complex protein TamA n=1 Tax=Ideonella sp. BN130291 TaxID=3112940 RepID=UPI002E25717D|nr:BamA/TamA family outer membrane protein [Ideonella sp. BN130291]
MKAALARPIACLLLALGLAGCGTLDPSQRTGAPTAPPEPLVELVVDAPGELKALLANNLDLARLTRLAGQDSVSDPEVARLVGAAPAQVRELLETEGYFQPVVQVRREPDTSPPRVRVSVQPGPRVHIGRVTFEVEGELERQASAGEPRAQAVLAALRDGWQLQPGAPFSNARWSDAKAAALAQLRAEGYAAATWSGTGAQVNVNDDSVRLFVVADSGPLFRAGVLDVQGLEHQDDSSVRNLAGFEPGAPLTDQLLLDYQERLQTSGLFDRASVVLDPNPEQAAAARVTVRVHELSLQQATVGIGYSANAGPRTSLEHWHRRLLGWPVISRTRVEWGRDRQAVEGDLSTHVKHDFWRNLLGYSVERQKTNEDTVTSASLRLGRSQDTPHRQRFYFVEALSATRTTADTHEQANALSGNYHWGWRQLDSNVLPTKGYTLSLQSGAGRAHDQSNRAGAFARLYGRTTLYRPLGGHWFGSARLELGQVYTANGVEVPDPLRFRAGGDESVRGYGWRTLAPRADDGGVTGGRVLFTTSLEAGRPVSARLPSVWWAVFVDAGRAADNFSELKPAVGVGAGVRWRSPVGPLRLDLAYGNETREWRLHASVGIAF